MPRMRDIKPGIATNEVLAELPPFTRLLFSWLPMWADREGRLEDRPKRLKAAIFPFDDVDMDKMLQELHKSEFIVRYAVKGEHFIQIVNFIKHQKPHSNETASVIPALNSKHRRSLPRSEASTTMVASTADQTDCEESPGPDALSLIHGSLEHGDMGDGEREEEQPLAAETAKPVSPMRQVFNRWREKTGHLKAVLTTERERKIRARLKDYSVEDLYLAIDGCRGSPFHQGQNDEGRVHDDIELICRDGKHVEMFVAIAEEGLNGTHKSGKQTGVDRYREGIEAVRAAYGTRREAGVDHHEGEGGL